MLSQSAGGSEPAAATFTPFPRPPLELHRKIVRIAALETMIVPVEVGRIKDKGRDLGTAHVVPIGPSSPLLQVNKEAHEECQMVLTAHHESRSGEPKLYLNEASGLLWLIYLDEWTFKHERFAALIPESSNGNLPKIRAIATGWEMSSQFLKRGGKDYELMAILMNMRKLGVEVLIVTKPSARFSKPWVYSDIEFRDSEEIDPANEPIHWKMLRKNLTVPVVTVGNIENAMVEYIQRHRDSIRGHQATTCK